MRSKKEASIQSFHAPTGKQNKIHNFQRIIPSIVDSAMLNNGAASGPAQKSYTYAYAHV
jgi:hypothetical protein